jgi:hypothetical protein
MGVENAGHNEHTDEDMQSMQPIHLWAFKHATVSGALPFLKTCGETLLIFLDLVQKPLPKSPLLRCHSSPLALFAGLWAAL